MEHISGSTYQMYCTDLEPGQTVYFHIVASGVTTTIEEQAPEDNEETESVSVSEESNNEGGNSEEEAEDDSSNVLLWSLAVLVAVGVVVGGWALMSRVGVFGKS